MRISRMIAKWRSNWPSEYGRSVKEIHPVSGLPDDRNRRHGADQLFDFDWRNRSATGNLRPRSGSAHRMRRAQTLASPEVVQAWIAQPPSWLDIVAPTKSPDAGLARLDAGERDAILLAEELSAGQIIIDQTRGRREAQRRGFPFTGTLGVLVAGAGQGLLDLRIAVGRLRQTSFRISDRILERLVGIE